MFDYTYFKPKYSPDINFEFEFDDIEKSPVVVLTDDCSHIVVPAKAKEYIWQSVYDYPFI